MREEVMNMMIPTPYLHRKTGFPVVISDGIGNRFSVYLVKSEYSLKRCRQFGEHARLDDAIQELEEYMKTAQGKKNFRKTGGSDES